MRSKSAALMTLVYSSCGGLPHWFSHAKTGEWPMNAINRSEQLESTEEGDTEFAAVSEVEAGIRDFVRNDIAYLRRPAVANGEPLDTNHETAVNSVNSLIQRVAGTSLAETEKLIGELEALRDLPHAE